MAYKSKVKSRETDDLYSAILALEDPEECYRFFDDLLTIHEIQSMADRWHIARLLEDGATYKEIEEKTGASTATISRISKCLYYGADGYRTVLKKRAWERP